MQLSIPKIPTGLKRLGRCLFVATYNRNPSPKHSNPKIAKDKEANLRSSIVLDIPAADPIDLKQLEDYMKENSPHDPRIIFDSIITTMEYTETLCKEADRGTIAMTSDVRQAIGQLLEFQQHNLQLIGFEKFQPSEGDFYLDTKGVEKVADINPRSEDDLGKIAEIIAPGYRSMTSEQASSDKRIVRTSKVSVYKLVLSTED